MALYFKHRPAIMNFSQKIHLIEINHSRYFFVGSYAETILQSEKQIENRAIIGDLTVGRTKEDGGHWQGKINLSLELQKWIWKFLSAFKK